MARSPKKRCKAKTSKGKPCKAWAIHGGTVCVTHGGAAPQVKAAAATKWEASKAEESVQRMLQTAGADVDPAEHLLDSLHRAARMMLVFGVLAAAVDELAEQHARDHKTYRGQLNYTEIDDEDDHSGDALHVVSADPMLALNRHGEATIHPYVIEYGKWIDRRGRLSKLCLDARIDERRIHVAEDLARQFAQAITGILSDLGILENPEVPGVVRKHLTLLAGA